MYTVTNRGRTASFEITLGLQEGYLPTRMHNFNEVIALHRAWQEESGKILGCLISPTRICYGIPVDEGVHAVSEPGAIISGISNPLFDSLHGTLDKVLSFAQFLAEKLNQERVYVFFHGYTYTVDKERAA